MITTPHHVFNLVRQHSKLHHERKVETQVIGQKDCNAARIPVGPKTGILIGLRQLILLRWPGQPNI